jgi:hypothetical protein
MMSWRRRLSHVTVVDRLARPWTLPFGATGASERGATALIAHDVLRFLRLRRTQRCRLRLSVVAM